MSAYTFLVTSCTEAYPLSGLGFYLNTLTIEFNTHNQGIKKLYHQLKTT